MSVSCCLADVHGRRPLAPHGTGLRRPALLSGQLLRMLKKVEDGRLGRTQMSSQVSFDSATWHGNTRSVHAGAGRVSVLGHSWRRPFLLRILVFLFFRV